MTAQLAAAQRSVLRVRHAALALQEAHVRVHEARNVDAAMVGRCRLTLSKPCSKRLELSALNYSMDGPVSFFAFKFKLRRYIMGSAAGGWPGGRSGPAAAAPARGEGEVDGG